VGSRKWVINTLLIAMMHFALVFTFLYLGLMLSGFESAEGIRGRIGHTMFMLAFAMMYPVAWLRDLHVPTIGNLPLWEGSVGDYFGGLVELSHVFLNSVLWAIVVYHLWIRFRARRSPTGR